MIKSGAKTSPRLKVPRSDGSTDRAQKIVHNFSTPKAQIDCIGDHVWPDLHLSLSSTVKWSHSTCVCCTNLLLIISRNLDVIMPWPKPYWQTSAYNRDVHYIRNNMDQNYQKINHYVKLRAEPSFETFLFFDAIKLLRDKEWFAENYSSMFSSTTDVSIFKVS